MNRDIAAVIAAALATVPLVGCPTTWNCNPPEDVFDIDQTLSAAQLDRSLEEDDSVNCRWACNEGLHQATGWEVLDMTDCDVTVDPSYTPPETGDTAGASREELPGGTVTCAGTSIEYYCEGRRPVGHVEKEGAGSDPVGRTLATFAHLEAASVLAFDQLSERLLAWSAPPELIDRCREAARDEVRHATLLTAEACARGAVVPEPTPDPAVPTMLEAALVNVAEGCVGECLAALLAQPMANNAHTPSLRAAFAEIAADETRHAQLSWDLHAWFLTQLAEDEAQQVEAELAQALSALPRQARLQSEGLPTALGGVCAMDAEALGRDLASRLAA